MSSDLIPPTIPEGDGKTPRKKQTGNEGANGQHNNGGSADMDDGSNAKTFIFSAIVFAAFECLGVYFWQIADGLGGNFVFFIHWVSLCCLVAGPFSAWHGMIEGSDVNKKRKQVWVWYIVPCILNAFVAYAVWGPQKPLSEIAWQPPELPKGCETVSLLLSEGIEAHYSVSSLTNGPYSKFVISAKDTNTGAAYGFAEKLNNGIQGIEIKFFIKNNRCYVQVPLPLGIGANQVPIQMNNDLDSQLPPRWDRNFNSNAFEIVGEDELPLLQVYYKRPDVIVVNGIFVVNSGYFIDFGHPRIGYTDGAPISLPPLNAIQGRKALFKYPASLHPGELVSGNESTQSLLNSSPANPVEIPVYIEGTQFTEKRLSEIFPFGYSVFFFGQNRIMRNEIFKSGTMEWKLNVDSVYINPDFYSGTVTWTIPNVNTTDDGGGSHTIINGGTFVVAAPLKEGCARPAGVMLGNKPVMHVMTLGDNQRTPVFAIGFRIQSEGEGRPPNPPYFFIPP